MDKQKERQIPFSNEWFSGQHRIAEAGYYPFAIYGLLWYIEPMDVGIATTIENILLWFKMETTKRRNADKIKEALKYLHEQGIIVFYEDIQHTIPASIDIDQIKNRTPLYIGIKERPQEKYTLIRFSEFKKLLLDEVHTGNAKVRLMCYFGAIISHINSQSKYCYPSLDVLHNVACISRTDTCSEYNLFLMDELKMIMFQSSGVINQDTGKPLPTVYVRYEDEDVLEAEMTRQRGTHNDLKRERLKRENTKARTSISVKISHKQKKLDAMSQDDIYNNTAEYMELANEIDKLGKEYTALQIEYDNLTQKRHRM